MDGKHSLPPSQYDEHGDFYYEFIKRGLADKDSHFNLTGDVILDLVGNVKGLEICDLACGEGHLSRRLIALGAHVTGIDLSENLLSHAKKESAGLGIKFIRDDVQELKNISKDSFDTLICNLALMDIEDLDRAYKAVSRVLKPEGRFIFSVLHPCFESPFSVENGGHLEVNDAGDFLSHRIFDYSEEGRWYSGGTGMRGTFGSIHRKVSTYINGLLENSLRLRRIAEPSLPRLDYDSASKQLASKIPATLVVEAENISGF